MQMSGGRLDVEMLVLASPRLGGQDAASMNFLEVAVGKLVSRLQLREDVTLISSSVRAMVDAVI